MPNPAISLDTFATFGDLLRYLRRRAQLTQQELAIAVGYSEAQISRLEHNHCPLEVARLASLFVPALHLEQEPEIVTRLAELAEQARGAPAAVPAPPAWAEHVKTPKSNLPAPLTSFIGRREELATVCELLSRPGTRLLTLTGTGGCGKTRLALRAGEAIFQAYIDGVWLANLAPLSNPALTAPTIAQALGITNAAGRAPETTLAEYLRERRLLLLLDNCEHLIETAARLIEDLLRACPYLQILATSREPLRVDGEMLYRVPPLLLPPEPSEASVSLVDIETSEAVQLFVERAQSVEPAFRLTEAEATAAAWICRRLDGLPLAIELAAARLDVLGVEGIAARLDNRFHLLTCGSRTALPRHRTMRASIEWSYALLSDPERLLLQRLSVFAGGCTLEAAEEVCSDQAKGASTASTAGQACARGGLKPEEILDTLASLFSRSLVLTDGRPGAEKHYRMLETIRQFAGEKLVECGGEAACRGRHLDYFLALASQAEPHLRTRGSKSWLDRLERELDNLRAALEWSLACQGSGAALAIMKGLQLATSLLWFWWIRGHRVEGARWLEGLLQAQRNLHSPKKQDLAGKVAQGRALNALSHLINLYINRKIPLKLVQSKEALLQESQAIFAALGGAGKTGGACPTGEAYQRDYAISCFHQAETVEDFLECRGLFQAVNDAFWMAECDAHVVNMLPSNDQRISKYAKECLDLYQEAGDLYGEGTAKNRLSLHELRLGNRDQAFQLASSALACIETFENPEWAAFMREALTYIAMARGDTTEVSRLLDLSQAMAQDPNDLWLYIEVLTWRAYVAWAKGEYEPAIPYCEEALKLVNDYEPVLYLLARIALSQGDFPRSRKYLKRIFTPGGDKNWHAIYHALQTLGELLVQERQMRQPDGPSYEYAAILFGAQDKRRDWLWNCISPKERSEYLQAEGVVRAALGERAFTAAFDTGRNLADEEIIRLGYRIADSDYR